MSKIEKVAVGRAETAMAAVRQIKTGADKLDFMRIMLPQRIEDGKVLSTNGNVLSSTEADDDIIFDPKRLENATRVTDSLLNEIFTPINHFIGSAGERASLEDEDEELDEDEDEEELDEEELEDEDEDEDEDELDEDELDEELEAIEKAIKKGKFEKAMKLLKEIKDELPKAEYKVFKKRIKNGK